ncbi:hypothetical protein SDD30_04415 [Moorella naiadis]
MLYPLKFKPQAGVLSMAQQPAINYIDLLMAMKAGIKAEVQT